MKVQDGAIKTGLLTLAIEDRRHFDAYLAWPPNGRAAAVLVLHDMFGLNEPIRAIADRYAERGYAALVPNLFWRAPQPGAISYDDAQHAGAWTRLKAIDLDIVSKDMSTAVAWLRSQAFSTGKVAALGFCGGGRWAYLAAARCSVDAAAALYGLGISEHLDELKNIGCPLQLHYGLQDQHVPQREIDTVAAGVRGHPSTAVFLYPDAGHSFANPVRQTYDAAAAALAHQRIETMLAQI
jgi:carboxymethylenebutenolidase